MHLTPMIDRALMKAAQLHHGQIRKSGDLPYIVHPYAVAFILSGYTQDEEVIAAGLLHDTIEDCGYTREDMTKEFGPRVTEIVLEVTEDVSLKETLGEKASWKLRKEKYIDHLQTASPAGMMVCAADKIHNLQATIDAFRVEGSALWKKFAAPEGEKFWFYEAVASVLHRRLDSPIVQELDEVLAAALKTVHAGS